MLRAGDSISSPEEVHGRTSGYGGGKSSQNPTIPTAFHDGDIC